MKYFQESVHLQSKACSLKSTGRMAVLCHFDFDMLKCSGLMLVVTMIEDELGNSGCQMESPQPRKY